MRGPGCMPCGRAGAESFAARGRGGGGAAGSSSTSSAGVSSVSMSAGSGVASAAAGWVFSSGSGGAISGDEAVFSTVADLVGTCSHNSCLAAGTLALRRHDLCASATSGSCWSGYGRHPVARGHSPHQRTAFRPARHSDLQIARPYLPTGRRGREVFAPLDTVAENQACVMPSLRNTRRRIVPAEEMLRRCAARAKTDRPCQACPSRHPHRPELRPCG